MKKVGFIFPGQGSQKIGMGKAFYENFSVAKEMFDTASDAIGVDFKALLFEENEKLSQTEFTQPAILLISSIAYKLFENEMAYKPQFFMGHSLGEFSSLVACGGLLFKDGIKTVHKRGLFMKDACIGKDAGMMVVLGLESNDIENITKEARDSGKKVWSANYNCSGQIVVAGLKEDLKNMESIFKSAGAKRAMLLDMSVASHCPLLDSASKELLPILEDLLTDTFISPVISNVTAKSYSSKSEAIELLPRQLVEPVRYQESIENTQDDVDFYIEFGGNVLKGINKKITKKETYSITTPDELEYVYKMIEEN